MALTPEDVLKKSFGATQFRRGYDEREVDDFLDEVVNELRDLTAQRDDYKRKYEESVKRGGGAVVTKVDDERVAAQAKQIEDLKRQLEQAKSVRPVESSRPKVDDRELVRLQDETSRARQDADSARSQLAKKDDEIAALRRELDQAKHAAMTAQHEASRPQDEATKAAGVLAMAQQLHDQLVTGGEAEKSRLIGEGSVEREKLLADGRQQHASLLAEAQERHKSLIAEATAQHDQLVGEASRKREEILRNLEETRGGLERDIVALRSFESKYKQQLIGFLEGKLHEAKNTGALEPKE